MDRILFPNNGAASQCGVGSNYIEVCRRSAASATSPPRACPPGPAEGDERRVRQFLMECPVSLADRGALVRGSRAVPSSGPRYFVVAHGTSVTEKAVTRWSPCGRARSTAASTASSSPDAREGETDHPHLRETGPSKR